MVYKNDSLDMISLPIFCRATPSYKKDNVEKCVILEHKGLTTIFHKNTINTIYNQHAFYTDDHIGSEMN
jgi:hypothetical protein